MIQTPDALIEAMPGASESAQSWIQHITDATSVIVALIGALILLSGYLVKLRSRLTPLQRMFRRHNRVMEFLQHVTDTGDALQGFVKSSGCMRGLLLRAENCEFLKPQRAVKVSVVCETEAKGVPRVRPRWQNWEADDAYLRLLHAVVEDSTQDDVGVLLLTREMREGVLRDYYAETGVVASVVFLLGITDDHEMLYVSLNFGEPRVMHDDGHGNRVLADLTEETIERHEALAKNFYEAKERVRRKARHLRSLWSGYLP